jgi:hypothetical protein
VSEIRKLISRWHRDELGAERKAARRKCSNALAPILDVIRKYAGARFAEGGGRFTGMPPMTLRFRYLTLKLRALCWVLRRLRAGATRLAGTAGGTRVDYKNAPDLATQKELCDQTRGGSHMPRREPRQNE